MTIGSWSFTEIIGYFLLRLSLPYKNLHLLLGEVRPVVETDREVLWSGHELLDVGDTLLEETLALDELLHGVVELLMFSHILDEFKLSEIDGGN